MWAIHYVLSIASFILAIVFVSQILRRRRSPGSTVAWLLTVVLIPHVGVPLFLIFGNRKIDRIRSKKQRLYDPLQVPKPSEELGSMERLLLASGVPATARRGSVRVLETGETAFQVLLETLKEATHEIHIGTFILALDPVGLRILELLEEKARAGVHVRLMLDGFGSFWTFRWRLRSLQRSGGRISYFLPLIHIPFFGHSNMRNHRKLVIVDGRIAIVGGMNLAKEYLGPSPDPDRWVDLSLLITGAPVADVSAIFSADWRFSSGETLSLPIAETRNETGGEEVFQIVGSGPDVPGDPLYDSIASAIFSARRRVWIATPYFIPDETLAKALELAAKRGVEVRLLIPKRSNHFLADLARRGYVRQLEQAGARLLYFPTMMHAKALIVDESHAIVGSANFDMRSLLLNFELGLILYSATSIDAMSVWYRSLAAHCTEESPQPAPYDEFLDGVGRVLGPLL